MTAREFLEQSALLEKLLIAGFVSRSSLEAKKQSFRSSGLGVVIGLLELTPEIEGALQGVAEVVSPIFDPSRAANLNEYQVQSFLGAYPINPSVVNARMIQGLRKTSEVFGRADELLLAACSLESRLDHEVFPPVATRQRGVPAYVMDGFRSHGFPPYASGYLVNKNELRPHLVAARQIALSERNPARVTERILEYVRREIPATGRAFVLQVALTSVGVPAKLVFGNYHPRAGPVQSRGWSIVRLPGNDLIVDSRSSRFGNPARYQPYAAGYVNRFRYAIENV